MDQTGKVFFFPSDPPGVRWFTSKSTDSEAQRQRTRTNTSPERPTRNTVAQNCHRSLQVTLKSHPILQS